MDLRKINLGSKHKRAAIDWTVGKLISLVLLIIVVALVIYGFSSGAFNPLKNKIALMYDGVLAYFGKSPADSAVNVQRVNVLGVGEGNLTFNENYCKIDFDGKDIGSFAYDFATGHLQRYSFVYDLIRIKTVSNTDQHIYFSYNWMTKKWQWSLQWSSLDAKTSWVDVPNVEIGGDKVASQGLTNLIKDLNGKDFASGQDLIMHCADEKSIFNINDVKRCNSVVGITSFVDAEQYTLNDSQKFYREIDQGLIKIKDSGLKLDFSVKPTYNCEPGVGFAKEGLYINCQYEEGAWQFFFSGWDNKGLNLFYEKLLFGPTNGKLEDLQATVKFGKNEVANQQIFNLFGNLIGGLKYQQSQIVLFPKKGLPGYAGYANDPDSVLFGFWAKDGRPFGIDYENRLWQKSDKGWEKINDFALYVDENQIGASAIMERNQKIKQFLKDNCI